MQRSNHVLLSKQSLTNLAALGNNAVLPSCFCVPALGEHSSTCVLGTTPSCKTSENGFWDNSKTKQLSPPSPPSQNCLNSHTHAVTTFKGQPNLQLVIHENCCIKTAQAVCSLILKKVSGTKDHGEALLCRSCPLFHYLWRHKIPA